MMRHGSLFSGIGGFDLAAEWMGWENVFHCEIEKRNIERLKKHWPSSFYYENIVTSDFTPYANKIGIITGGDPCQPHSKSGKRKGKDDTRYLWPEMLRAIRETKSVWVVNENVRGSIGNGVLDQKIGDLENEGYTCWPPLLMPSCAKGIHERYRVWMVAYSNQNANSYNTGKIQSSAREGQNKEQGPDREWMRPITGSVLSEQNWKEVASRICGNAYGLSDRVDRNGAIGNSIDPGIAYEIFKAIEQYELITTTP
jgi:DNA (cytosine-5)-methyltransferase 1